MRAGSDSPTIELLHLVRTRLWVAAVARSVLRAVWVSAGILLASACVHTLVLPHPALAAAAVSVAVVSCGLAHGLVARRPSASAVARETDVALDANWLLVSALDQLMLPPSRRVGAAQYVIARAEEQTFIWKDRMRQRRVMPERRQWIGPISVAMVAAFLYQLPAAVPSSRRAPSVSETGRLASPPADIQARSSVRDLLAWRRHARDADHTPRDRRPAAERAAAYVPHGESPAQMLEDNGEQATIAPTAPIGTASSGASGPLAGNARPVDRLHGAAAPHEESEFGHLDILRPEGDDAQGSGAVDLLERAAQRGAAVEAVLAIPAPAVPTAAYLPPTLRAYTAAYLGQIRDSR